MVVHWREKRGGKWVPEDRLRATLSGALVLVPVSILVSGLVTEYVRGWPGITLNLVCLFFNGVGVRLQLPPTSSTTIQGVRGGWSSPR